MSTNTGLPPGWTIRVSRTHNKEYFLNQSTKEASWEPPFGTDNEKLNDYLKTYKNNGNKAVVGEDSKIRASHILIKNETSRKPRSWKSDEITRSRDEAIQLAKKHQARILNGEATFTEIAETESDCSSHVRGGDLGFFTKESMQPSFANVAFGLHVGELSDVVESDSGIHLIQRTG
ncbi:peptidyl-prolyl cis-trans isomerase 1 [Scheffersomyces coipomensis]|uniref:peptidyl-prolyl cis-trans isomerase 1 n=1 Tax=Scheffersomyces coipomensis TaxID=1788519 RepID=UPI00315CADF7